MEKEIANAVALANFYREIREHRRGYEFNLSLSIWALVAASTIALKTIQIHWIAPVLGGLAIIAGHTVWMSFNHRRAERDAARMYYYVGLVKNELLSNKANRPPWLEEETEQRANPEAPFWSFLSPKRYPHAAFQWAVTVFIVIAAACLLEAPNLPSWQPSWQTIADFLDHWQGLFAGLLGFVAATTVVIFALQTERRKAKSGVDALRKSLAFEIRLITPRCLEAYRALSWLAARSDSPITSRMVENVTRVPSPLIYTANADKIGLLGPEAMELVIFYGLYELARDGLRYFDRHGTPDDLSPPTVDQSADSFFSVCRQAAVLMPKFRTGDPSHDAKDEEMIKEITEAAKAFNRQT
jgi:hypothetical protein